MAKVRTEEELRDAVDRLIAKIVLYGDLGKPIVKIRLADRLCRIFAITGLAVTVAVVLGTKDYIIPSILAVLSFGCLGVGYLIASSELKKLGDMRSVYSLLRKRYRIMERKDDRVYMRKR